MALTVHRAGMATTLQDLGRRGWRAQGVPQGGALDSFSLRVANLLVGNPEGVAALEMTLVGPELEFETESLVAVCGAEFEGIPTWRPFVMAAGERLRLGTCVHGSRAYLAIAGGFQVETVLGGQGTYLTGKFGGWEGRVLRAGDLLPTAGTVRRVLGRWHIDEKMRLGVQPSPTVRVVRGPLDREEGAQLAGQRFRVTAQSDRIGLRLDGPRIPIPAEPDRLSSAVIPGSIQVPPDGMPIVLLADAQTLGGYPLAAHVISADLSVVAQLRPGDEVGFREISLDDAHALAIARESSLALLRQGLADKFV